MHTVMLSSELGQLSREHPLLFVFLRHSGCPFCKQALADMKQQRAEIERLGTRIVLVHMMSDTSEAQAFFDKYELGDVPAIADPEQKLYQEFQLERGGASQLLGPKTWWKGLVCTLKEGHFPGKPVGDLSQLAGVFLVRDETIVKEYRHQTSSDRPNYVEIATPPAETVA